MDKVMDYENEYIKLVRIDSSNKWLRTPHFSDMSKQWEIIILLKKPFSFLDSYKFLQKHFYIDITPVMKGVNKGCFGIRLYNMKKNPTHLIVKQLLDFIFEKKI